jgi:small subunit ribosomal protein S33
MAATVIRPMQLAALTRTRCSIFQTAYNPTSTRTGAKYLRARLRGPSMVKYYPPEANIAQIVRQWPELEMRNYAEEERLQEVEDKKKRGKGAPKKAKEKGELRPYSALVQLTPRFRRQSQSQQEAVIGASCAFLISGLLRRIVGTYYIILDLLLRMTTLHLRSACSFHACSIICGTVISTHL